MSGTVGEKDIVYEACPICKSPCTRTANEAETVWKYKCPRCGEYEIESMGLALLNDESMKFEERWRISSFIGENSGLFLDTERIEELKANPPAPPNVRQCANHLLFFLARTHPNSGKPIRVDSAVVNRIIDKIEKQPYGDIYNLSQFNVKIGYVRHCLKMLATGWIHSVDQLNFLIQKYLHEELRYLNFNNGNKAFTISPKGWDYIQNPPVLEDSNTIFVAMSFDSEMFPVYEGLIDPGIRAAGYDPVRVDMTEHTNKIDDEIIALIRQSKLIVADFTQQKNGVYFEAGFALGQNKQVVWMCEKAELDEVHFDTRQYNAIDWKRDEFPKNIERIKNRIIAIAGRGRNPEPME